MRSLSSSFFGLFAFASLLILPGCPAESCVSPVVHLTAGAPDCLHLTGEFVDGYPPEAGAYVTGTNGCTSTLTLSHAALDGGALVIDGGASEVPQTFPPGAAVRYRFDDDTHTTMLEGAIGGQSFGVTYTLEPNGDYSCGG